MNHDQQNIWVIVLNPYVGQHYILLPSGAMGWPPYPTMSPANSWLIPAREGFTLLARTAENHQRIRSTNCRAQRTNRRIGPGPTRKSGPNPCGSVEPWSHNPATNWHFRHWWTAVAGRNAAKRRAIQLPLDVMGYRKLDVVGFVVVVADIVVDVVAGSPGLERVAAPFSSFNKVPHQTCPLPGNGKSCPLTWKSSVSLKAGSSVRFLNLQCAPAKARSGFKTEPTGLKPLAALLTRLQDAHIIL